MSIFLDTSFLVALNNANDELCAEANSLLSRIEGKEFGQAYCSDYVLTELPTVIGRRTKNAVLAKRALVSIANSTNITILFSSLDDFNKTIKFFCSQDGLSFVDCSNVVLMKEHGIEYIASFDSDFDSVKGISRLP
ncbi:type II toxin-antitoxin system VapC family toxin [Candidatus Micrarchaeota archaeon]|nr:type II toxin-antitoxin system VapC family toxin [Candidatus Micrarchaeota archaeon]